MLRLSERSPGLLLACWLAFAAALVVVPSALVWMSGSQPIGAVDERTWVSAFVSSFVVAFMVVLDRIGARSFTDFEPALGGRREAFEDWAQLTRLPAGATLVTVLVLEVIITAGYLSDPVELANMRSLTLLELAVILINGWIAIGVCGVLAVHTVVQLRAVVTLHAEARAVDILDPGPAHAFARLTSATGIGFVILGVVVVGDPTNGHESVFYAAEGLVILLFAATTFVLPLWGMRQRLAAEKARLLRNSAQRIGTTMVRVHQSVDTNELSQSAAMQASLASLIAERDLVSRLSPWPWTSGTLRGFVSAVMLPVVVWALTRALERVV
jgi:hypothetical protein